MMSELERWEARFSAPGYLFGTDLETWPWPVEAFDVIVGIFFQFLPPALRQRVFTGTDVGSRAAQEEL